VSRGAPGAVALTVAAVTSLQLGAGLAVTLFDDLGPAGTAFLRQSIAAVVLWALWRPRVRGHPRSDLRVAALFGLVLGLMNVAIYAAMDRIPMGIAVTLEFLGPLGVAVAASRRPLDGLWVLLAAAGIVLLADLSGGSDLDALGAAFALIAAALWAAYIHLSARTGRLFPGGHGLAIAMVVGATATMPLGVAQGGSDLLALAVIAQAAVIALASSVVPYSFEMEALRRLPPRVFGVLMSLEPAVAALAGLIVLGQELSTTDVAAIGLVVAASAGASLSVR
jgi:inner membrane transporter RhtA